MFGNNYGEDRSTAARVWLWVRPLVIYAVSFTIAIIVLVSAFEFVMNRFVRPVDSDDSTPVIIEVKAGSSSSGIASLLYGESESNRLIRSKAAFKIYVDFTGAGSKLKAGTYSFDRTMSYKQIVDMLIKGDGRKQTTVKFTLTEGVSAEAMERSLVAQGVLKADNKFLEIVKTAEGFKFELPDNDQDRKYALEGYLFPDTYEVFADASETTVINKLLVRFNDIFTADYIERANELGLSIDEVVTLASLIEKEAKTTDFKKVSAVFHNRLKEDTLLQSCPTVQYVLNVSNYVLTAEQLAVDSPYNTYKYEGLPAGPICNPGKNAIEAALYPDEAFLDEGYMYFCLREPESGELAFAKTQKEHQKNVDQYEAQWLAYDRSREDG